MVHAGASLLTWGGSDGLIPTDRKDFLVGEMRPWSYRANHLDHFSHTDVIPQQLKHTSALRPVWEKGDGGF